jgi:uncharacterized membrane protein
MKILKEIPKHVMLAGFVALFVCVLRVIERRIERGAGIAVVVDLAYVISVIILLWFVIKSDLISRDKKD